jgi:hypothetical protein
LSLALRDEHRLSVFKNRVLRRGLLPFNYTYIWINEDQVGVYSTFHK